MKKIFFLLFLIVCVPVMKAQKPEQYKIKIGQFDKLKVSDNVNVVYRCLPDSTGWAQYRGSKEFSDAFILTPKDGTLKVQVSTEDVGNPDLPTLYVYSDFLTSVENLSDGTLTVEDPASCAQFSAREIGNGKIVVEGLRANTAKGFVATGNGMIFMSGSCRDAVYQMLGTGVISADRLEAQNVQCKILGGGTIGCWAVEKLNSKGIGPTKIYYKGDPIIKKYGGGSVLPLPEGSPLDLSINEN